MLYFAQVLNVCFVISKKLDIFYSKRLFICFSHPSRFQTITHATIALLKRSAISMHVELHLLSYRYFSALNNHTLAGLGRFSFYFLKNSFIDEEWNYGCDVMKNVFTSTKEAILWSWWGGGALCSRLSWLITHDVLLLGRPETVFGPEIEAVILQVQS